VGLCVIIIRSVKKDEQIEQVATMADAIWHECFSSILSEEQINYMLEKFQSYAAITEQIETGYQYFLVILDMETIGYFGICKQQDGSMFLSKLYLQAEHRGKGHTSQVFQFIREKALQRRSNRIWLTVNKQNQQAIAVYEHLGMQRVREQATDIGEGFVMDDYVYEMMI
jgi:GNAT superfamily N-acetyltransferase